MKLNKLFLLMFICNPLMLFAQINERFDGEKLSEIWQGDCDRFVLTGNRLRLNAPNDAADKSYLSAPSSAINNAEWNFSLQMNFNPTSSNHLKIYLCSDSPELTGELNGYYLQIGGNTDKQILLYQKQAGKTPKKLGNSEPKRLDINPVNIELKVTKDDDGNWTVWSKKSNEEDFTEEFSCQDATVESSAYAGFVCIYTKTNSANFFFNSVFISGEAYVDTVPPILPKDIIINEVLFNPPTGGTDYVEIYNRSNKVLDLSKLDISNRRSGNLYGTKSLAETKIWLPPRGYKVLTADKEKVCSFFDCQDDEVFLTVPLPAFANDSGYVVLTDRKGVVIDEFKYAATMHSPEIKVSARKGVALERQSFESDEWNSATSDSGFGTPGYQNSKRSDSSATETIAALGNVAFLPYQDKDGNLTVLYNFKKVGYIANISIFSVNGRLIRKLGENLPLSTQGTIRWDGKDESGRVVPVSSYILLFEAFHPNGEIFRKSLVGIISK